MGVGPGHRPHGGGTACIAASSGALAFRSLDGADARPSPGLLDQDHETWWASDAQLGWRGPDGHTRLVIANTDPQTLPDKATWYLATNLARPAGPHDTPDLAHEPADLTEVVRHYGIRH